MVVVVVLVLELVVVDGSVVVLVVDGGAVTITVFGAVAGVGIVSEGCPKATKRATTAATPSARRVGFMFAPVCRGQAVRLGLPSQSGKVKSLLFADDGIDGLALLGGDSVADRVADDGGDDGQAGVGCDRVDGDQDGDTDEAHEGD